MFTCCSAGPASRPEPQPQPEQEPQPQPEPEPALTLSATNTVVGSLAQVLASKYAEALTTKEPGDPHPVAMPASVRPPCKSGSVPLKSGGSVLLKYWTAPEAKIRSIDWPLLRFRLPEPHDPADFSSVGPEGELFWVTPRRMASSDGPHLLLNYARHKTGTAPVTNTLTLNRLRAHFRLLKGCGSGYCGFVNVTAGSRPDMFHGQLFAELLPLWQAIAAPDAEVSTSFRAGDGGGGGGTQSSGSLQGWPFEATAFDSGLDLDTEALAMIVWRYCCGTVDFNKRHGLGADLLFAFCAADGERQPATLKALVVPRKLVPHTTAGGDHKTVVKLKPQMASLGSAKQYDLDGKVLSGLLSGVAEVDFEAICGGSGGNGQSDAATRHIEAALRAATMG
jgi:hypothetical protein